MPTAALLAGSYRDFSVHELAPPLFPRPQVAAMISVAKHRRPIGIGAIVLAVFWLVSCSTSPVDGARRKRVFCKRVIDGDTIVLSDGIKVRYLEINAPEVAHKDKPGEPFGREAAYLNKRLVEGKRIDILVASSVPYDQYGRLLAHVFLLNGKLVSEVLLKNGLAHCCFYQKPDHYAKRLVAAQRSAILSHKGIWSIKHHASEKYYIGNRRSLKFHRPWCPLGQSTAPGNRIIFKTRKKAFLKGYCPCKRCRP